MNLKTENLSFRYGRRSPEVLSDVNITFEQGEVVGLLGPNGAGKSTLLYLISGALTPGKGEVTYDGVSTRKRLPGILSEIFLVAEEAELPRMSLQTYIDTYSRFYPKFDMKVMDMALQEFGMEKPRRLDSLSMGQKKKIVLSFAFACNTSVTLLDEPTNGLDIPGKAAFRRLVAKLADDSRLFVISTHQIRDIDTILDRVMIMNEHKFLLNNTLSEIQDRFVFVNNAANVPDNALYSLPSVGGTDYMIANEGGEETEVNIEILFGAVLQDSETINKIMKGDRNN